MRARAAEVLELAAQSEFHLQKQPRFRKELLVIRVTLQSLRAVCFPGLLRPALGVGELADVLEKAFHEVQGFYTTAPAHPQKGTKPGLFRPHRRGGMRPMRR